MELTKQHFDETIKGLAKKDDLEKQTKELKAFAKNQTEELARIVKGGFDDVISRLDVKDRVVKLEKQMSEMKTALHLN